MVPEQVDHELRQRLLVRDGLPEMRQQTRNQRHALMQWPVKVQAALSALDNVVAECEVQPSGIVLNVRAVFGQCKSWLWAGRLRPPKAGSQNISHCDLTFNTMSSARKTKDTPCRNQRTLSI